MIAESVPTRLAMQLFQHYGGQMGTNTSAIGREKGERRSAPEMYNEVASAMFNRARANTGLNLGGGRMTLEDLRAGARDYGIGL